MGIIFVQMGIIITNKNARHKKTTKTQNEKTNEDQKIRRNFRMKKEIKTNKGITLIALVITIVLNCYRSGLF